MLLGFSNMRDAKKKEDQEYIDSMLEKQNTSSKQKQHTDFYKSLDGSFIIGSLFVSIFITLFYFFTKYDIINININDIAIINSVIPILFVLFVFSVYFVFLSFLFWLFCLLFVKTKNHLLIFIIKLLISIILTVLVFMSVMPGVGDHGSTPTMAKTLLSAQINNPGAESCTDPISFTRSRSMLSAEGTAINTGFSPEQVYFINPENLELFDTSNSKILIYNGTTTSKVNICVLCDNGKTELEEALQANGISSTISSTTEGELLCAVYPRKM